MIQTKYHNEPTTASHMTFAARKPDPKVDPYAVTGVHPDLSDSDDPVADSCRKCAESMMKAAECRDNREAREAFLKEAAQHHIKAVKAHIKKVAPNSQWAEEKDGLWLCENCDAWQIDRDTCENCGK